MFDKILIANRGEIAVRIIRACREMGIRTVAVCSEVDREALHAQLADETICIGPNAPKDSYLNVERILSAALSTGAEAIHPGFGFLSENSRFARMTEQCGLTFIGPSAQCIDQMGNKAIARSKMIQAGVPVIPGSEGIVKNVREAKRLAQKIGYPVMIKAAAGGGGRGMRLARTPETFKSMFEAAQLETQSAFGDDGMYLERYIENARHIEFQIMADKQGNVVHLGERDCSIQRRNQKMIEESPSTALTPRLRRKMGADAVKAAKAVDYNSAGTVEFLLTEKGEYFFMEMNTRIQVEHPVTEMVTGRDLIREMIRVAAGETLSFSQNDVGLQGHAIECRINAEDPEHGFRPTPGHVTELHFPGGFGVRVDSALYSGYTVPPYYDSMLTKLIVHSETREDAVRKMQSALGETVIGGVTTNVDFLYDLMHEEAFLRDDIPTIRTMLEEKGSKS